MFLIILTTAFLTRWQQTKQQSQLAKIQILTEHAAQGQVITEPRTFETGGWQAITQLEQPVQARVMWRESAKTSTPPRVGDQIRATGTFHLPEPARNPAEFNPTAWFAQESILGIWQTREITTQAPKSSREIALQRIRQSFHHGIILGLDEKSDAAKIIRAVVAGTYPRDSEPLLNAFRLSGTLHAFSVSGMHVVLVGSIAWLVLGRLGISRTHAAPFLIILLFSYAWITGSSPPALRAAWMAALMLLAFLLRRRGDLLNSLGAIWLALCLFDGECLTSLSVQLSYTSVFGIGLFQEWLLPKCQSWWLPNAHLIPAYEQKLTTKQKFQRSLVQQIGAGLGAWGITTPLVAWNFGIITPIALFASMLLAPLFSLLLALGLLGWLTSLVAPTLAQQINAQNAHVATATYALAEKISHVPGASFPLARGTIPQLVIFDLPLGGAAHLLHTQSGSLMIDTGNTRDFRHSILPLITQLQAQPDSLILSHADAHHIGASREFLTKFSPHQILLPAGNSRSQSLHSWQRLAPPNTSFIQAHHSQILAGPNGSQLEIFTNQNKYLSLADDQVSVILLTWNHWKFLFLNDCGFTQQQQLLSRGIHADVVILSKHSHEGFPTPAVISAFHPKLIVIPRLIEAPPYHAEYIAEQFQTGSLQFTFPKKSTQHLRVRTTLSQETWNLSRPD